MRILNRVYIIVTVLLMAGLASATVWNPTEPNDIAAGFANWNKASNWSAGIPGVTDQKPVFNVTGAVECRVTDNTPAFSSNLVQGDGGPGGVIRVMDGGTITQSDSVWSSIGYNNTAKLIVEEGGVCNFDGHLWWGMHTGGDSIVEIKGGFVTNNNSFGLGEWFGTAGDHGQCKVYITNNGELNIHHWTGAITSANPVFWNGSLIDIGFGKMVIRNDSAAAATEYITAGRIKGFGGMSTPTAVFANGVTTITAPDPMHRAPVYTTVQAGSGRNLTWMNMAPVAPATDVWVDVWFGTDPNKLGANYTKVVSKGKNATTVTVNAPLVTEPTTYFWQVDSYVYGDPALVVYDANNTIEGIVTPFDVTNNTPPTIVISTPRTATWINEPIQLDSTLTDDGATPVNYLWTATSGGVALNDPNVVFSPSAAVADPTVTVNYHSGPFTVTVTVDDGFNAPASASVTHDCALDACQATTAVINLDVLHPGDIAVDCNLNLEDFAVYALNWLNNYQLTAPVPQ